VPSCRCHAPPPSCDSPVALSADIGHSGVSMTLDGYDHLMPGNEAEAATLSDGFLAASA
jgi:hypothetical protein